MSDSNFVPSSSGSLAGEASYIVDVRAIETRLHQCLSDLAAVPPRIEVSHRDHHLYVFLTTQAPDIPADYAVAVYATVAALRLPTLTQLEVIDGEDRPQVGRWRQRFELSPPPDDDPSNDDPSSGRTVDEAGLAPQIQPPIEAPDPDPDPGERVSEAIAIIDVGLVAATAAPGEPAEPAISTPARSDRVTNLLQSLERSRRLNRGLALAGLLALGLGLGSAVTQWRTSGTVNSEAEAAVSSKVATTAADALTPPAEPDPTTESVPAPDSPPEDSPEAAIYLQDSDLDALEQADAQPTPETPASNASPPTDETLALAPAFAAHRFSALRADQLQLPTTLTLHAVGDIIPGTDYQRYRLPQDWQTLFGGVLYQLQEADLTFGNFESTLTEVARSAKDTSRPNVFAFRTPPWYASVLRAAGFDVLSVANNHSFDFGEQGFADTIANIELEAMKAVGRKGEIVYTTAKDDLTLAFIGFSHLSQHNTVHDLDAAAALVQEANANADIVVVSFHAGKEGSSATAARDETEYFFSENRGNTVRFSRTVIDNGADLVLGHGPHVPRALELYQGRLIAYSLGNFLGYRSLSTVGPLGTSLILRANLNAEGEFLNGQIIPVALDRNGIPYLDDQFKSVVLVRSLTRRDFPDTPLEIDDLGYIWRKD